MNGIVRIVFLAALCVVAPPAAFAQQYPNRPIRLTSPFPPGGGTDAVARIIAQALSDQLGQQVVVDSRGGANGVIGTELAAKSAADGYTLLLDNSAPLAILPNLTQKLPCDPVKDFSPISLGALSAIAEFLPGYEVVQWYGVLAPAATPGDIIERLHREIARTVANPKLAQLLTNMGLQPTSNTPDEFRALIRLEIEKWAGVIKAAGIKGE